MNERPLDEIVAEAVERAVRQEPGSTDTDAIVQRVLQDPDLKIILEGYDMHDRAEGLESVMVRDIRRMVEHSLGQSESNS